MTKEEFKAARKRLKLTQSELGEELGVSNRTIQSYEYGKQTVPKSISFTLEQKLGIKGSEVLAKSICMDVENMKTLTLEKMANFCIRHKDEFLAIPEIKILIDYERKDAEAKLMEQHIILRNIQNKESK